MKCANINLNLGFIDLFDPLLFLYFLTLHADLLAFPVFGFQLRINNLLALFLLVALGLRFRSSLFFFDKTLFKLLGFIGISLALSLLFAFDQKRSFFFFVLYGLTTVCYVLVPYFLIIHFDTKRILKLYLMSFLIVGLYALSQLLLSIIGVHDPFAQQQFFGSYYRPNAFAYEPSFLAIYFTPFLVIVTLFYLLNKHGNFLIFSSLRLRHVVGMNLLFLISTSTTTIFAYMIFVSLLFGLFLFPFVRYEFPALMTKVCKFVLFFGVGALVLTLLFPAIMRQFYFKFFYAGFSAHNSFYERWAGIENAWQVFLLYPILGVGMGAFPSFLLEAYLQGDNRFIFLWQELNMPFALDRPLKLFEPSNVFTEVMASLGIFGLIAFFLLVVFFIKKGRKALMHSQDEEHKIWIFVFFVSTLVTLIVLQVNQGLFRTYIWTHFAISYALFCKPQHDLMRKEC